MRWLPAVLFCLVLVLRAGASFSQALDNLALGQADALLRNGKAEEAWQLLAPLELQHAGQPDFDYLLGIAALESGRPDRATFVFERVVTVNPGHVAARLEMARAYFALRDFERAEREFNFILQSDPPREIRSLASRYLERMRDPEGTPASGFSGYVELTLGRDSNVNAASALSSVFVPALGTDFVPDPLFRRTADEFAALGAGIDYARALTGSVMLLAGAELRQRAHTDVDAFDSRLTELQLGLHTRLDERNSLQYNVRHTEYDLDHARYRRMQSAAAEWSRSFGTRARIAFSAQGYRIRYLQADVQASSSDLVAAGASAAYVVDQSTRTLARGVLSLGRDNAVAGRADGDRRLYGLSAGLQRRLATRVDGYASLGMLKSDYAQTNLDFGVTRRDRQVEMAVGLSWQIAGGWFLRPQVSHTNNRSSLALNEYRRTETSLTLRRVWD